MGNPFWDGRMTKAIGIFLMVWAFLGVCDVYALGGENGEPEVTVYADIADDGVLMGVGIDNPSPLSNSFIPLNDPFLGTVHTDDLWFIVYVPKSLNKDEIDINIDTWKERAIETTRNNSDGSVSKYDEIEKYDEKSDIITLPVKRGLYLEEYSIKTHKNLTHVKLSYNELEWEMDHLSTPAGAKVDWVNTEGDLWFLYLKVIFITMLNAFISFGIGGQIMQIVRYVPPISILETVIAVLFLVLIFDTSYSWLEFNAMNYEWYIMQLPATVIMTFLSLQFYKPDKKRLLALQIPKQREGPNIEVATNTPLIVPGKDSETRNDDILVHRWSWRNVICRLFKEGPTVEYDLHQKFHTKDINGIFDEFLLIHPDHEPEFIHSKLKLKKPEWNREEFIAIFFGLGIIYYVWKTEGIFTFLFTVIVGLVFFKEYLPWEIIPGKALMKLAPQYELDKLEVMTSLEVVDDNNKTREKAEIEVHKLRVQIQSKSSEKAFAMFNEASKELGFGSVDEESEKEEKPKEETEKEAETDDLTDVEKKKKSEE